MGAVVGMVLYQRMFTGRDEETRSRTHKCRAGASWASDMLSAARSASHRDGVAVDPSPLATGLHAAGGIASPPVTTTNAVAVPDAGVLSVPRHVVLLSASPSCSGAVIR